MKLKTKKITLVGKFVIFALVLLAAAGITFAFGGFDFFTKEKTTASVTEPVPTEPTKTVTESVTGTDVPNTPNEPTKSENSINLSISEKINWKPILDANGGLTTQPGSIYDKLGIKVNITLENNPDNSSQEFIDNKVQALGYTVNGYAALYKKFQDNKVETVMPYIVDSSVGGDGIIVRGEINSLNDFVGKKIGVPAFSSDYAMVVWLLQQSDLTTEQMEQIKKNIIVYPSVKKVAEAFFNGEVDIAGVRQPFLTQAKNTADTKVMFTTKSAKNIIANGIVFRKDFADANPELVTNFIDGAFQAIGQKGFENVKVQPSFKDAKDADLEQMLTELKFNGFTENMNYLNGMTQTLFEDMNKVWEATGEQVVQGASATALTKSYVEKLNGKYKMEAIETTKIDDATKEKAKSQDDSQTLLKKSATINFQPNSANFLDPEEAAVALEEFVKIAKFLDGAVIQVEGNVANVGSNDPVASEKLSLARATAVAKYLENKGVDPTRFIVVGNGISKQIGDNKTTEGQAKNRRTDISFKVIE